MGVPVDDGFDEEGSSRKGITPLSSRRVAVASAVAGALSGAISRFVVGPLDVMKIRFQVQIEPIKSIGRRSKYTSMRQALVTIVKEEGIQGLWRGTIPGQLLAIPYTAVQFVTLQQLKLMSKSIGYQNHPLESFVTGALAGTAATIASYPFDLLRTTLAAQGEPRVYSGMMSAARGIYRESGIKGLYRGVGVTIFEIMPYAALQFGLYDSLLKSTNRISKEMGIEHPNAALQNFVCGLGAGTMAKLGTHPLDVAKKRFQVAGLQRSMSYGRRIPKSASTSLLRCMADIARNEGLIGFYKGALPSVLKAAPSAAITFACYDFIFTSLLH